MKLSVIIPCYNESKIIKESIKEIYSFLKQNKNLKDFEIICIDDGSSDNTYEILKNISLKNKKIKLNKKRQNKGKGFSVREGFIISKFNLVLFADADLSTPINELDKFLDKINEADILIASRNEKDSKTKRNIFRSFISKAFLLFNGLVTGLKYSDTQCGFKLFKKENTISIFKNQKIDGFAFDIEILLKAKNKGLIIKEIPIKWIQKEDSKVNIIWDSLKMALDIIKIRIWNF